MNRFTSRPIPTDPSNPSEWLDRVVVRTLTASDLPALEWDGEYRHFRRVYASAFERAQYGLSVLWVADDPDDGIIGQVFIQLTCDRPDLANGRDRAYLYSFRIKPPYRSRGLGQRMMATLEADLIRRSFRILTLNVAKDNPRALELYRRTGFRVVGHEPGVWSYPDEEGVWHQVVEPAWRMEKPLVDHGSNNSTS